MSNEITDYNLPDTAYATFDAQSLKTLILDRLKNQNVFTDQIYEGSNLSSFIDVIAYSYHVLLFYLNRTASESNFSEATIYENINRIVKLLNYSPLGFQTCSLTFTVNATEDMAPGTYTIPRYTFINNNSTVYSFSKDVSFTKYTTQDELISIIGDEHLLYQGEWVPAQEIRAVGSTFETVALTQSQEDDTHIDHFSVNVYVKHKDDNRYYEYTETTSLYLHKDSDRVYEKRLNEDLSYEIKFGNGITGRRLDPDDIVQIYYLESKGDEGRVGPNFLDDGKLVMQGTTLFNKIIDDVISPNVRLTTFDTLEMLNLTNESASTFSQARETVDDIKKKAPIHYTSQDRVVTKSDFEIFMSKNFDRILASSNVVDNNTYLEGHFNYLLETIGIANPTQESRVMFNHLDYASANTSNNVYIYAVPRIIKNTSLLPMTSFLNPSQKQLIQESLDRVSLISVQPILMDPVYMAVSIGTRASTEEELFEHSNNSVLQIKKENVVTRDDRTIIEQVVSTLTNYFDNQNTSLGQLIEIGMLGQQIIDIPGIDEIYTLRTDTGQQTKGLSMCVWNNVYDNLDVTITNQNLKLPYYKFPYLFDPLGLKDKIVFI